MQFYSITRILAIGLTLITIYLTNKFQVDYVQVLIIIALGHYLLAYIYSGRHFGLMKIQKRKKYSFILFFSIGCALYLTNMIPLLLFFGFHHVLSDTYVMDRKYIHIATAFVILDLNFPFILRWYEGNKPDLLFSNN